jgi:hypothetical protein
MDGTAVQELSNRLQKPIELAGVVALPPGWTAEDPLSLVEPGPQAAALDVYSLGAIVDYVKENRDALPLDKLMVHVVSPQLVRLLGPLQERSRVRETYVQANAHALTDGFLGGPKTIEDFIVGLQTRFVESAERASVLKLIGNITQSNVTQANDDGVSQAVVARRPWWPRSGSRWWRRRRSRIPFGWRRTGRSGKSISRRRCSCCVCSAGSTCRP